MQSTDAADRVCVCVPACCVHSFSHPEVQNNPALDNARDGPICEYLSRSSTADRQLFISLVSLLLQQQRQRHQHEHQQREWLWGFLRSTGHKQHEQYHDYDSG